MLLLALLSLHLLSGCVANSLGNRVVPIPQPTFDKRSLQLALDLKFGGQGSSFTVAGRGVSSSDVEFSSGYFGEAKLEEDGVHFGADLPGYVSVKNVDLRGQFFLDNENGLNTGLIIKMKYNFGKYSTFCVDLCTEAGATTCLGLPTELKVPDSNQVLFSNLAGPQSTNFALYIQRNILATSQSVTGQGRCDNTPVYNFILDFGIGPNVVYQWNVYSYHGIWLEDGNDHEIVLVMPRNGNRDFIGSPWSMLYIDHKYICAESQDETGTPSFAYCKTSLGELTLPQTNPWFVEEEDLTSHCPYSRFFFGSAPTYSGTVSTNGATIAGPNQYEQFQQPLLSAVLKSFEVWNYNGIMQPDDPFLCGFNDMCYYYRGSPWCRSTPEYLDYEQWAHKDMAIAPSCHTFATSAVCEDVGIQTACANPVDACGPTEGCCLRPVDNYNNRRMCVPLSSTTDCTACGVKCSPGYLCCEGGCTLAIQDQNNCYACGNKCLVDCCPKYGGCTGTDLNCDACGSSCLTLNTDSSTDFHCCPTPVMNPTNYRCVNFLANDNIDCGACGNTCTGSTTCCSGDCVTIGDNENCNFCGDVCKFAVGELPKACCNNVCVTLDTDNNCGSCGHDCGVISKQQGKSLHCCDGLCVEWGVSQTSCGCPSTNCEQEFNQRLGVTSYHCCADAMPPTEIPQCLDFTSNLACGACGNVCTGTFDCCSDAVGALQCLDLSDQNSCGACNTDCGPIDIAAPTYCCADSTLTGSFAYSCLAIGTNANCGGCGDACSGMNGGCCPVIGFPIVGTPTVYACKDILEDPQYCGSSCIDCTVGGTVANSFCCNGVCTTVNNDLMTCGCPGACTFPGSQDCCLTPPTAFGVVLGVCTPLQTNTDCSSCGDACDTVDEFACCPTMADATKSTCTDTTSDNNNCGKCGRACLNTEVCCNGECTDQTTIYDCGGCGNLCNVNSEFCCDTGGGPGPWGCVAYGTADTACGCPGNPASPPGTLPVDCTMIMPPPENHDGQYTCCKGLCVPTWENCVD